MTDLFGLSPNLLRQALAETLPVRPMCPVVAAVGFTGSPPPEALILCLICAPGATVAG